MADRPIDPQILEDTQPQPQPQPHSNNVILPLHSRDDLGNDSEGDGEAQDGTEKRRKLNLWKCNKCRDARKKCLPEGRIWPQKCDRCLQHRPELECSEPMLNDKKRGPSKKGKPAQRSNTQVSNPDSTPERQEPPAKESDVEETPLTKFPAYERPARIGVGKRERLGTPPPEIPKLPNEGSEDDPRPAAAYLPLRGHEFRLLKLEPGNLDAQPVCSFVTASIEHPLVYEAISYLYAGGGGAQLKSKTIKLVDSKGGSHALKVRNNLYTALQTLRHPVVAKLFWVDALCVNHHHHGERNSQVAMKRFIFYTAQNVCFWLGEDEISKAALPFIPRILDLDGIDKLVQNNDAINGWVAFVDFLTNTVFSRLWFVPEVAVAREVSVHCGLDAVHYGDLVDAVVIFASFRSEISLLFRKNHLKNKLLDKRLSTAERFIDVSTNAWRVTSSGKIQRMLSLEALVSQLSDLSSSDPRDRIFSVLGIAKDITLQGDTLMVNPPDELQIDYDEDNTTLSVYQEFVAYAIKKSRSLDIICRNWTRSVTDENLILPSWVRPLQYLKTPFERNSLERTDADSLVGLPDQNYYHASRGSEARFKIEPNDLETGKPGKPRKSLIVQGFRIDTISKLGFQSLEGIISQEWLELGGCVTGAETVPEEFWRTLVADRGVNGSNPPSWYCRDLLYCLQHLTPSGNINTSKLIMKLESESSLVVAFLQRVQSVIWNRKFLVSKKNAWMGLAPTAAEPGDIICILYGCSVPVVLRPPKHGSSASQLVGECYVHGMMDGEAMESHERNEYPQESFEII